MKQTLLIALIAVLAAGCGKEPKLQENTEAYFAAHGIVPGQDNELRIGGTLFRFPAGVGLNPYTAQEAIRTKDGSPMTLSQKECLEQGKCEKVATPIVKGQVDKVTFYLDPTRDYAPSPNPYGGGVAIDIEARQSPSKSRVNANLGNYLKEIQGRKVIEHPASGLREYLAPKSWIGSIFEDVRPETEKASGHGKFFGCQPGPKGFCFIAYWDTVKNYQYVIMVANVFVVEHWPVLDPAVARFMDSVIVK